MPTYWTNDRFTAFQATSLFGPPLNLHYTIAKTINYAMR